ncbi:MULTISPECIES: oxygen-insensitive NADPH nitroreductase [Bacillaceae]|uniref:Oxygen-insensitive NADPH nitroreductase n=2 Tax=Bacillaceae TaxID=186817 RepID=A0A7V7V1Q0_9BACI|nr:MULTISPECIES: oxygen-insensitive NADPH nitroreductase [Bacillaceae]KAB2335792.1 oxygen-insensitive NADPH nitroreductase [Bacillus mesophilum]QVY59740.1 oxygen-insensitive NADPH nitroreductase [Cytobacillus gottheilii]
MNETIKLLKNHRSVRLFEDRALSAEQIEAIVTSAQSAATSSFIQAYSIIGVTDQQKKDKLAELTGGQEYVAKNGHFFVFCADLFRHELIGEIEGKEVLPSLESTEKFMVALIDTALAAQNAAIAAESMGLGICYIGGIRNNLEAVTELLKTPKRVIPLFGMTIGYPMQENDKKQRLPYEHVYHENEYNQDLASYKEQLSIYDEFISDYYNKRTNGKRSDTWSSQMAQMLEKQTRMYMKEFVNKQGFDLK